MNIQSYFSDIREHIIDELKKAKSSIYIAVAWFTDKELFDILCKKASLGLKVELIAIKDEINNSSSIDFTELLKNGGKVWLVEDQKTMHNKFCVIDKHIVLNGSYNWTYKASDNHENIMVITNDNETTDKYLEQFKKIKSLYFGTEKEAYHKLSLRLTALKNLIQLNDIDDILKQGEKIKSLSLFVYLDQYKNIQSILDFCKGNRFDMSIQIIDELIIEADNFIPEEEIAANTYDNIFEAITGGSIIGIELFLRQGVDINITNHNGDTLLHLACKINHSPMTKYLINRNIIINCLNNDNLYPIDLVNRGESRNDSIFSILYENGAFLNMKNDTLCRQFTVIYSIRSAKIIPYINSFKNIDFSVSDCYFVNLLRDSIKQKDYDLAKYLLDRGVDIDSKLSNGESIFKSFDFRGTYNLEKDIESVKYLIEKGANWKEYFGSEVFLAIFFRDMALLQRQYSLTTLNPLGQTPLYYLCLISFDSKYSYKDFTIQAIEYLSKSVSINFQLTTTDSKGISLIDNPICKPWLPIITKSVFKRNLFLKANLTDKEKSIKSYNFFVTALETLFDSLESDTVINTHVLTEYNRELPDFPYRSKYLFKENLLGLAIVLNDFELVNRLINNGADLNSDIDINGHSIFHVDKTIINNSLIAYDLNFVKYNKPSDGKNETINYMSCLEYARRKEYKDIEKLLVEHGALISECDKRNNYVEKQIIISNLTLDKENRDKELEKERKKIEQQRIEDIKKKEVLEYENSNFLKKLVINYNRNKKK